MDSAFGWSAILVYEDGWNAISGSNDILDLVVGMPFWFMGLVGMLFGGEVLFWIWAMVECCFGL